MLGWARGSLSQRSQRTVKPWWDGATWEGDYHKHMSRWDSATPADDCMMLRSSDDIPEPIGTSAAGAARSLYHFETNTLAHRS